MKKLIFYPVLYLILSSFILACGNKDSESPAKQTNTFDTSIFKKIPSSKIESIGNFKKYTIDPQAVGSAFSTLIDLEKDGKPEIILSRFNKVSIPVPGGNLSIYKMGKDLNEWMKIDLLTEKDAVKVPNHTSVYDIDSDGDEDIFLAHGFLVCKFTEESCGGIIWFENLGNYKFKKHVVLNNQELFYHDVNFIDLDEDGIKDILTVGEERLLVGPGKFKEKSEIHWIKGTKNGNRFENKVRKIAEGAGAFIRLLDIDKDGDLDWASAEFFHGKGASFTWFEKLEGPTTANPAGKYKRHIIDDKSANLLHFRILWKLILKVDSSPKW